MAPRNDGRLGFVAGAATFPARAAASVCRDRLEDAAEAVLAAPGTLRAVDRAMAGPLPEELVRSVVRNHVLERMLSELTAGDALDELLTAALRRVETQALVDRVVASEEMRRALREVMQSPEVRRALADQTTGFSEEVVAGLRGRAAQLDERADHRRSAAAEPTAGIASRALAFAADAVICAGTFTAVAGVAALAGRMVGGLRPEWLAGLLLSVGLTVLGACYFVLFWTTAGRTPGMQVLNLRVATAEGAAPPSVGRALVRLVGLALAIIPLFAGFLPVLFDSRRRGLADMLAGTVVVYGPSSGASAATVAGSGPARRPNAATADSTVG